jgi:hypothetical protein
MRTCHSITQRIIPDASQRYSPELQKKALARREQTQQDFDNFTTQLKEAARSDKPSKSLYAWRDAYVTAQTSMY